MDDAYKSLRRTDCQAIYSSAFELKTLLTALRADGASPSISPVWNADAEIQKADKLAQDKEDAEARQKLQVKTQWESEDKLARSLDAAERATKEKQQAALRSQFGKLAAATSAALAKDIHDAAGPIGSKGRLMANSRNSSCRIRIWFETVGNCNSFNSDISDYGRAEWTTQVGCNDNSQLQSWKTLRKFNSQWLAQS